MRWLRDLLRRLLTRRPAFAELLDQRVAGRADVLEELGRAVRSDGLLVCQFQGCPVCGRVDLCFTPRKLGLRIARGKALGQCAGCGLMTASPRYVAPGTTTKRGGPL